MSMKALLVSAVVGLPLSSARLPQAELIADNINQNRKSQK